MRAGFGVALIAVMQCLLHYGRFSVGVTAGVLGLVRVAWLTSMSGTSYRNAADAAIMPG